MKKLDVLLIFVILASVGVIGWRVFHSRFGGMPLNQTIESAMPTVPSAATHIVGEVRRGYYWIYGRLNKVTENEWKTASSLAERFGRRVKVSDGCADGAKPSREYINHVVFLHAQRMAEMKSNVLLSIGNEVCHRVGDIIHVLSFDSSLDRPLVEYLGSIRIKEVLMIMPEKVTDEFMSIMGPTKQEYLTYVGRVDRPDTAFYFESAPPRKMDFSVAPPTFPNTKILKLSEARSLAESGAAILVDVRSKEEFGQNSGSNVVNIPYTTERLPRSKAIFAESKSKFGSTSFDLARLLTGEMAGRQVIVVGSGPSDVRPILALYELMAAERKPLAWVYEGIPAN